MDLFNVLGRLIGKLVSFIWNFLPSAVECLGEELGGIFIKTINVFGLWSSESRDMAKKWRRKLFDKKVITQDKGDIVWSLFYLLAYAMHVASCVIASYISIWIFERMFNIR